MADLRALVQSAQGAVARIDAVTGETGGEVLGTTLPSITDAVKDLAQVSRQAGRAVERLEQEPQSLIYGPSAPRPGPGEPGFLAPAGR